MEKIKKIGEITCVDGKFVDWVIETLENTRFVVNIKFTPKFDTVFEIYKKEDQIK